ncbi:hypothetical protein KUCAC02_037425, partial [Chaenocephalus aceratus]
EETWQRLENIQQLEETWQRLENIQQLEETWQRLENIQQLEETWQRLENIQQLEETWQRLENIQQLEETWVTMEQQGVQDSKALGVFQETQVFQDLQVCRVSPDMKDPSANQDSQDATGQREMLVTQGSLGLQVLAAFKADQDCEGDTYVFAATPDIKGAPGPQGREGEHGLSGDPGEPGFPGEPGASGRP